MTEPAEAEPAPQPEPKEPQTVDFTGECRAGVICHCQCGKVIVIGDPNAMQAALMGASIKTTCSSCKKTGLYNPAPDSPRMRPVQAQQGNRHQRRAAEAMARHNAPSGLKRAAGGLIVPR